MFVCLVGQSHTNIKVCWAAATEPVVIRGWKLVTSWISSVQANPLRVIAQIFEIPWFWSSLTARNAFVSEISDTKLRWAVCQQSGAGHTFSGKRTVVGVGVVWRGASQLYVGSEFMKKDLLISEIQSETWRTYSELFTVQKVDYLLGNAHSLLSFPVGKQGVPWKTTTFFSLNNFCTFQAVSPKVISLFP